MRRLSGFIVFVMMIAMCSAAYAEADYDALRNAFLSGDMQKVDRLSEQYLSASSRTHRQDAIYLRALALLDLGRMMEARSQFRQLEEASTTPDEKAAASASVGDTYFYENDLRTAEERYRETLNRYPNTSQTTYLQNRLSEISGRIAGRTPVLRQGGLEESGIYSVQVGSFSKEKNAQGLLQKLLAQNYSAFLDKDPSKKIYRVRVGHLGSKEQATQLQTKLKKDGYPTKITP